MKKTAGIISTILLFVFISQAQDFVSYGQPYAEEIAMKECAFDKEADAVILLDEAISTYNDQYNLITNRHVRIKILKEKGIEYANITIPFYRRNDFEFIKDVQGMVINIDNTGARNIYKLEKKLIYTRNINEYRGEVTFAFPSVKVGSIIEYKYESVMKHYGGLDDWVFQADLPVVQSKYSLFILPNTEFSYSIYKSDKWNCDVKPEPRSGSISFSMENIPGLREEPYMDARRNYLQRVVFQLSATGGSGFNKRKYMTSWNEVVKEMLSESQFGGQLDKDLSGTQDFVSLIKMQSAEEKMRRVYNYVRDNMGGNGYYGIYSSDGVKTAWNKKKGSTGEVNLILVNLLKSVGLEAYPMLACERHYGKVYEESPFIEQFNTVYAVVIINGKKFYLDANEKFTPAHITPYSILNTTGLIVNRKSGGLIKIADESLQYRDVINLSGAITGEGNITGDVFVSASDYARISRLEQYKKSSEKYIDKYFRKSVANAAIDSFAIKNTDSDSLPLNHNFKFTVPLNSSGDYKFVQLNLFTGLEQNPFVANNRLTNINFGYKQAVALNAMIAIPDDYKIDALPKSVQMVNPDKTIVFSRSIIMDESSKKLVARIRIEHLKSLYTTDEYADIKEFYKKMFEYLNEPVVLTKSAK